ELEPEVVTNGKVVKNAKYGPGKLMEGKISAEDVWMALGIKPAQRSQQHNENLGVAMRALGFERVRCAPGVALRGTDMPAARSRGGESALRLGLTGPRLQHFTKTKTNRSSDAAAKKGLFSLFFAPFCIQGERPEACPTAHREGVLPVLPSVG